MNARDSMRSVRKELEKLSEDLLALRRSYEEGMMGLDAYFERRFRVEVVYMARAVSSLRRAFRMD